MNLSSPQSVNLMDIDEIPLDKRKDICTEIDFSIHKRAGYWERLVTELGFTETDSKNFILAFAKSQSPTENLLRECSYRNYKIGTLSHVLKKIGLVKLAEKNLEHIKERDFSLQLPRVGHSVTPRRATESDSTNSSHSTSDGDKIGGLDTIHYPYEEIVKGTKQFSSSMKLGAGAFGKVYKVNLNNTIFACKVLTINSDSPHFSIVSKHKEHSDLRNELRYLAEYRHPNIIPLYGWSLDGKDPCLIYRYMKNGSLQDCLQRLKGNKSLSWLTRVKVACDAARGLQFLHGAKSKPLIHGDIKTANILLDDSFVAQLGDFGLAREGPRSQITGSYVKLEDEHTPGTMGYLAFEYIQSKKLSVQVDTYAFGVVLLELYTGRRAFDRSDKRSVTLLRDYMDSIAKGMGDGGPEKAEDRLFEHQSPDIHNLPRDIALRFVKLALECCHEKRIKRPAMRVTLERLEALQSEIDMLNDQSTSPTVPSSGSQSLMSSSISKNPLYSKPGTQGRIAVERDDLSLQQDSYISSTTPSCPGNIFPNPPMHVNPYADMLHPPPVMVPVAQQRPPIMYVWPYLHNPLPPYPVPYGSMVVPSHASNPSNNNSSDPKSDPSSATPGSPGTPLSTPEPFTSFDLDEGYSHSGGTSPHPLGPLNPYFPASPQNHNPFLSAPVGAYAIGPMLQSNVSESEASVSNTAEVTPNHSKATTSSVPVKVNQFKADMMERLRIVNENEDSDDILSKYLES